ncbi:unnamed protein product, partial [Symbiodinium microadriaticum]
AQLLRQGGGVLLWAGMSWWLQHVGRQLDRMEGWDAWDDGGWGGGWQSSGSWGGGGGKGRGGGGKKGGGNRKGKMRFPFAQRFWLLQ